MKEEHWARLGEATSELGIRLILLVNRLFGRRFCTAVLAGILPVYWFTNERLRRASFTWLSKSGAVAGRPGHADGLRHLMRFAETITDKFLAMDGELRRSDIRVENEHIMAGDAPSQGCLLLTSHTGCQELLAAASCVDTAHEVVILQHTAHARRFNELLRKASGRPPENCTFLEVTDVNPATAVKLSEALERGAYIVIAGDRIPVMSERAFTEVTFMGAPCNLPTGGALLALLLKCPLRMMTCTRTDERTPRYRLRFESLCEAPAVPRGQRQMWLQRMMQAYASHLEAEMRAHPLDWFNFFDFWKTPEC